MFYIYLFIYLRSYNEDWGDYGCFIYDNSAKVHSLQKFDIVQNQALRVIGGFIKSTPILVMESELSISPLFVGKEYLSIKYILETKSYSNNLIYEMLGELSALCTNRYW